MTRLTQAYTQAPWRKQLQMIGYILLALVSVSIVAGIYLNITTRTTEAARSIQQMQLLVPGYYSLREVMEDNKPPIEELRQNVADLETELAYQTSYDVMLHRAMEMGLRPIDPENILYLPVAGYSDQPSAVLAPPPSPVVVSAGGVSAEFKESLIGWLGKQIQSTVRILSGVQP